MGRRGLRGAPLAMFKWFFGLALIASIAFCAAMELRSRQKLEDYNDQIENKRLDVMRVQSLVNEVTAYQTKREELQKRIDMINALKIQQRGPVTALAKLGDVDPNGVQSIAVVGKELVVNRR